MRCEAFLDRIDKLLEGGLAPAERDGLLAHLATCADCRDLVAAFRSAEDAPGDPALSHAILARTSGATCQTARSRLCARLDGEFDASDAALVDGHLSHCPTCAGLARAVERLRDELPRLATVEPGHAFTMGVLARTSRRPRREPLAARVLAAGARLMARPRIAWEGAFVATAVLALPAMVPGSPVMDLAGRTREIVRPALPAPALAVGELRDWLREFESSVLDRSVAGLARVGAGARDVSSNLTRSGVEAWRGIRLGFGTLARSAASERTGATVEPIDPGAAEENAP
jgi:anti-sigma factor RsiW